MARFPLVETQDLLDEEDAYDKTGAEAAYAWPEGLSGEEGGC